jgi:hypothetical protein
MHRDSLGFLQPIKAGAVNLMTAGSGIVHSERAGDDLNEASRLHGIQSWMVLPGDQEEIEPAFAHYPADDLPELTIEKVTVRVILGQAFGYTSLVTSYSPVLYLECRLPSGSELALPEEYQELAAYVVSGEVQIDQKRYSEGVMTVACPGKTVRVKAFQDSFVMAIGGESVGDRHIWWNFVSSSKERIEQAKTDWKDRRFGDVIGESEFIPLPDYRCIENLASTIVRDGEKSIEDDAGAARIRPTIVCENRLRAHCRPKAVLKLLTSCDIVHLVGFANHSAGILPAAGGWTGSGNAARSRAASQPTSALL